MQTGSVISLEKDSFEFILSKIDEKYILVDSEGVVDSYHRDLDAVVFKGREFQEYERRISVLDTIELGEEYELLLVE